VNAIAERRNNEATKRDARVVNRGDVADCGELVITLLFLRYSSLGRRALTCCSAAGRDDGGAGTALAARPQQQRVRLHSIEWPAA